VARYRNALPQLGDRLLLADGGLETWLINDADLPLPEFAAFPLVQTTDGRAVLLRYLESYAEIAGQHGLGIVLDTPTWRANPDWGTRLGFDPAALEDVDRAAVELIDGLRERYDRPRTPLVISGCIGPRYDAYAPQAMSAEQARSYHAPQVEAFARSEADLVTAMTLGTVDEAVGIAWAARAVDMPVAIAFTTETDGRLPDGTPLARAITDTDTRTEDAPAYYLVNCSHPSHFVAALDDVTCRRRIRGVRANASRLSHAELDESEVLDRGDPADLARWYVTVRDALPNLTVTGGCCGTDHRHVDAIGAALV
jgi:S-methylmethionine-dependent homocysteine/selenocysteine methylase